jgi:hypothetical protein
MLGLSTLKAMESIEFKKTDELKVISETMKIPRRSDLPQYIESMQQEQDELLSSLRGTSLNFKTFLPLYIKYNISKEYPSYYSHRYLHEKMNNSNNLEQMDSENRRHLDKYMKNVYAMEKLARIQENMSIAKSRLAENEASGEKTIDVEVQALKIGDFVIVSFPGEVSVQAGLNIKKASSHKYTFLAGYTNGYIHYAPAKEQFNGHDYEDTNCLIAPEWQQMYEDKVKEILGKF